MEDEILDLNIQITELISTLSRAEENYEIPDIRDLKDKDDEYNAWSNLYDLRDKLDEAIDLINNLKEYEYE